MSDAPAPTKKRAGPLLVAVFSLVSIGGIAAFAYHVIQQRQVEDQARADDPVLAIRSQLAEAERLEDLWIAADKAGDEPRRKELIVKTRDACNAVIDKVDKLRTPPYIDPKTEEFRVEYIYIEDMAQRAGRTLFEITRRSRLGDF